MYQIGDNLVSKVNTTFRGYYTVVDVKDGAVFLDAYDRNGARALFRLNPNINYDYKQPIKWVKKNMTLIPPRPAEIQEDSNDFPI